MKAEDILAIDMAAALSQIGCVGLPGNIQKKVSEGIDLLPDEDGIYQSHAKAGAALAGNIPGMDLVVPIILYQEKHYDGSGFPADGCSGKAIPLGSRILRVCFDYNTLLVSGCSPERALEEMQKRDGWYDPDVLSALHSVLGISMESKDISLEIVKLEPGMVLADSIRTSSGSVLLPQGKVLTKAECVALRKLLQTGLGIQQPVRICPQAKPDTSMDGGLVEVGLAGGMK